MVELQRLIQESPHSDACYQKVTHLPPNLLGRPEAGDNIYVIFGDYIILAQKDTLESPSTNRRHIPPQSHRTITEDVVNLKVEL